jgi:fructose-1,6-bisphosphatase/sedoheptulose 1,7-bisphosphatase-like protein
MKQREIFTYRAPWDIYGLGWSTRSDQRFRLAVGSFIEEYSNKVQVWKGEGEARRREMLKIGESVGKRRRTAASATEAAENAKNGSKRGGKEARDIEAAKVKEGEGIQTSAGWTPP